MARKILVLLAIIGVIYQFFMLSGDAIKYIKREYAGIKKAFKEYKKGGKVKLSKDEKIILGIAIFIIVMIGIAIYRMIYCPISDAEMISSSIILAAFLIILATDNANS